MKSDLGKLYPSIYRGVVETDQLIKIGDMQFDEYFEAMDRARKDQFVATADSHGLSYLERLYEIKADPEETIEFRRERLLLRMNTAPPFTIRFLRERLDEIIGKDKYHVWVGYGEYHYLQGQWRLGEKPFQEKPYVLYIETVAGNNAWYQEVQILVGKIKPAHIVYRYVPMLAQTIGISEEIQKSKLVWNYRQNGIWRLGEKPFRSSGDITWHYLLGEWELGEKAFASDDSEIWNYLLGEWKLGEKPFADFGMGEVIKMRTTPSITPRMLADHAEFSADSVTKVLLNDLVEVLDLQISTIENQTIIRYKIPNDVGEVTNIKLFSAEGKLWSESAVFIENAAEEVVAKHIFYHKEAF